MYLGWGLVIFTIGSILSGVAGVFIMGANPGGLGPKPPPGQEAAQFAGMIIGGTVSVIVRVAIIAAYGVALVQFNNWYSRYGEGTKAY